MLHFGVKILGVVNSCVWQRARVWSSNTYKKTQRKYLGVSCHPERLGVLQLEAMIQTSLHRVVIKTWPDEI